VSDNPYEAPKSECDRAKPPPAPSRRSWFLALKIASWIALGSPAGWAASTLLWQAGYLRPWSDHLGTFLVMVGPMILTGVLGAMRSREVLPRLITLSLVLAGFVWLVAPERNLTCEAHARYLIDEVYPYLVVPATIVGGVVGVASARKRSRS
jgi:hypothetical protein